RHFVKACVMKYCRYGKAYNKPNPKSLRTDPLHHTQEIAYRYSYHPISNKIHNHWYFGILQPAQRSVAAYLETIGYLEDCRHIKQRYCDIINGRIVCI